MTATGTLNHWPEILDCECHLPHGKIPIILNQLIFYKYIHVYYSKEWDTVDLYTFINDLYNAVNCISISMTPHRPVRCCNYHT